jgi:hypothetical protein
MEDGTVERLPCLPVPAIAVFASGFFPRPSPLSLSLSLSLSLCAAQSVRLSVSPSAGPLPLPPLTLHAPIPPVVPSPRRLSLRFVPCPSAHRSLSIVLAAAAAPAAASAPCPVLSCPSLHRRTRGEGNCQFDCSCNAFPLSTSLATSASCLPTSAVPRSSRISSLKAQARH